MIAIVKYNAGNIGSVTNALTRLGVENKVTDDPDELKAAEKVIFPGVGEASTAMKYLRDRGLDEVIISLNQPVLGICLGMQLMCSHSEEGNVECLGIFETLVKKFPSPEAFEGRDAYMKVPHMGWNRIGAIRTRKHKSVQQLVGEASLSFPPVGDVRRTGGLAQPHRISTNKQFASKREYAGKLRREMTESEVILWSQIKNNSRGTRFSRQKPVGGFIPDFVSHDAKLIIEVDGSIHLGKVEEDRLRQRYLESQGYTVLRFKNNQVKNDLSNVLDMIDYTVSELKSGIIKPPYPPEGGKDSFPFPNSARKSRLLRSIKEQADVYYVHSYYAVPNEDAIAVCDYIIPFASMMQRDNFYATQFHPEKSAAVGEQILRNFLDL